MGFMKHILAVLAGLALVIAVAIMFIDVSDVDQKTSDEVETEVPALVAPSLPVADPHPVTPRTPVREATPAAPRVESVAPSPPPRVAPPTPRLPERTQSDLERMISINRASIDMCYSLGTMSNPMLSGTIVARIVIEVDGTISGVQWTTNTLNDQTFEQCLRDEILAWRFEPAAARFTGNFTFTFSR